MCYILNQILELVKRISDNAFLPVMPYIGQHESVDQSKQLKLECLKFQMQIMMGMLNENVIEIENRRDH